MELTVHDPLGVTVTDLAVDDVGPAETEVLRDLLAEHGVVVLPDQEVDDAAFTAFLRGFGELQFTVGETPVDGHPDLNVITNVGRDRPPRSSFHVDTSYVASPPSFTALRAVTVPAAGGETLFTDQRAALETLPDGVRRAVDGRTITHVVTGLDLDDDAETSAVHPVVRRHPRSGDAVLYLSTRGRCAHVSGLDDTAAADLVDALLEHSARPDNTFRHRWRPGDVVVWDNARVLHRADHSAVDGERTLHRGMVGPDGYGVPPTTGP